MTIMVMIMIPVMIMMMLMLINYHYDDIYDDDHHQYYHQHYQHHRHQDRDRSVDVSWSHSSNVPECQMFSTKVQISHGNRHCHTLHGYYDSGHLLLQDDFCHWASPKSMEAQ